MAQLTASELLERILEGNHRWAEGSSERDLLGAPEVPSFVFGILIVQAIFFFSFGLNQWLQYRGLGRWADYAYGEKVYLVLSLAAKSALAWQIYGGSLAD